MRIFLNTLLLFIYLITYQLQNNNKLIKSTNVAVLSKNIKCISIKNHYFFLFLSPKKFV